MVEKIIELPISRYNELLKLETRVDVIVERILHSDFLSKEDILWILDTELSTGIAQELHDKAKKEKERCLEKLLME